VAGRPGGWPEPQGGGQGGRRPRRTVPDRGAAAWGETGSETVQWTVSRSNARPVAGPGVRACRACQGGDEGQAKARWTFVGQTIHWSVCSSSSPTKNAAPVARPGGKRGPISSYRRNRGRWGMVRLPRLLAKSQAARARRYDCCYPLRNKNKIFATTLQCI